MLSYTSAEAQVPAEHPLRPILRMCDQALQRISPEWTPLYSEMGRPSIPPEQLLRPVAPDPVFHPQRAAADGATGLHLAVPLVRRFEHRRPVWSATTFSKNRERLLKSDMWRSIRGAAVPSTGASCGI
jgi:hypothetical protein